jgi:hypothetical protein
MTAYVSNKCPESASFVRLLRERQIRVRIVTIEDADAIPWYVDTVPSLVVHTRDGLDVYAADDAFAAIESGRPTPRPTPRPPRPPRQCKHDDGGRDDDDDEVGCVGSGEAMFEDVDGGSVISCVGGSNYESLLSKEDERAITSKTVAAWERTMRAEAECRESSTDTADKRLEMLMKTRGEQQQQQQPKPKPKSEFSAEWGPGHRY